MRGLFCSKKVEVKAIEDLSFSVKRGESVAFIGPNGAGKSTTIKMLTGILYPTSGSIEVLGLVPWERRKELGLKIGTVFGQRTQLWHHLPPRETFDLLAKIYSIEKKEYHRRLKELVDLFEIERLMDKPVRSFSLGERMRCEIVASLLHSPEILFLDEPTIGLDINAKLKIRSLLNTLSQEKGVTLFLTSHDTADIEQVCKRVLVLDKGRAILDSNLKDLKKRYLQKKVITLVSEMDVLPLKIEGLRVLDNRDFHFVAEFDSEKMDAGFVISSAMKMAAIKDVAIEDASMEEIIGTLYRGDHG